jgi:hypothetical protein
MDATGFDSRKGEQISSSSHRNVQTDTGRTQPSIQRELELLVLGLKRPEFEANCSPRYFTKLEKKGAKYVTPFYAFLV